VPLLITTWRLPGGIRKILVPDRAQSGRWHYAMAPQEGQAGLQAQQAPRTTATVPSQDTNQVNSLTRAFSESCPLVVSISAFQT
jgi:hypothetical protein